ncbi:helix-turn-helix transcriptional regulator [Mycolicibacterium brumae]|uniref:AraC family transcriptional regulator n=1 Tax=Mycolicibacterium brumae TaxID=85968 RepID=A0A2G5PG12_9MYCO|nr:helix-turn-helix transcriptional regulator [Mycolicibacterium brumae]MCV7194354.1 helix-turn-helix transcriptional regulator [Mycolicibacterium brumae]PIB77248.1 AraC family transcriptional regulator [Mycolicibacterium brumae]RWA15496.1 hypothetical protein MBRU_10625 [Mycolicibacterium brumae DSM 44177]UWW10609.1 helix-turn-helix transcriptional regulator [Mycolicibacterium brumae]
MTQHVGRLHPAALRAVVQVMRAEAVTGLSATDAADHAAYSPFHFNRLFAATTGVSPGAYLTSLRIDAAKRLLLADPAPVIDVATEVGFDSLSSFSRRFRAVVGTSPAAFRALADHVDDGAVEPFRLVDPNQPTVRIRPRLPEHLRPGPRVELWIGWFPKPAPIGLPAAGALTVSDAELELPLCPDAPWLLSFAVSADACARERLAPSAPLVARHPAPLTSPTNIDLHYRYATPVDLPMLPALPALAGPTST